MSHNNSKEAVAFQDQYQGNNKSARNSTIADRKHSLRSHHSGISGLSDTHRQVGHQSSKTVGRGPSGVGGFDGGVVTSLDDPSGGGGSRQGSKRRNEQSQYSNKSGGQSAGTTPTAFNTADASMHLDPSIYGFDEVANITGGTSGDLERLEREESRNSREQDQYSEHAERQESGMSIVSPSLASPSNAPA